MLGAFVDGLSGFDELVDAAASAAVTDTLAPGVALSFPSTFDDDSLRRLG